MRWPRELIFVVFLLGACRGVPKESKKKLTDGVKRAVETYSYSLPASKLDDKSENAKPKVVVETIKSISPSEYLTPSGKSGFIGTTFEANTPNGKVPLGSVTFNAFEPETTKKESAASQVSTETTSVIKKKPIYRYYTASASIGGSSQDSVPSSGYGFSTNPTSSGRTSSAEAATTLQPQYHFTSRSSASSLNNADNEKGLKIITTRGKFGNGRYTLQKIVKKAAKIEPKLADSKPEETGFNGYHYDVGSLSYEGTKHSGPQPGMMGASYMRSSSPFYNFHVMLD